MVGPHARSWNGHQLKSGERIRVLNGFGSSSVILRIFETMAAFLRYSPARPKPGWPESLLTNIECLDRNAERIA